MDLLIIFKLLLRRKWILIIVPFCAAVIAFVFKFNSQREFKSTLQLATGFTTNDQIRVNDERFSLYEADVKFNNLIESINSPVSVGLLSYKLLLHDLESQPFRRPDKKFNVTPELLESAKHILKGKYDSMELLNSSVPEERNIASLLKAYRYDFKSLKKNLLVKRVNFTDFVGIEYFSENPKLSAFIVNTLAAEFLRYYNTQKTERSGESVDFFTQLVAQKRKNLDVKAEQLKEYKSANNVLDYGLESATKLDQISNLEKLKNEKENEISSHRLSIRRLDEQINLLTNKGTNVTGSENQNIINLRNKVNALNSRYIAGGSSDKVLLDSIVYMREQLRKELSSLSNSYSNNAASGTEKLKTLLDRKTEFETSLEIAEANLISVEAKLNNLRFNVSGFAGKEAIISDLQREVDVASQEYLEAQEKLNMAKNTALTGNPVRITLFGQPAVEPEPSKTIIVTLLAGAASFFICAFAIIFMEYIDMRIKSPFYFQKLVDLPLAGSLNLIKQNDTDFTFLFDKNISDPNLITFKQLIRKMRFEVESHNAKVILVTSPKPGEGKTFVILSLSYSLSLIHKKVLIIDTNFKNTSLTKLLVRSKMKKLPKGGEPAEINQLSNQDIFEDSGNNKRDFISLTKYKNIHVIGSRIDNDSPSEILSGRDFSGMLSELRNSYDYIFMEGAAMNDYPDTKELIGYADKIVAVFSADSVVKQLDKESIGYLKQFNGKLIGAILNRVAVKDLDL